LNLVYYYGAETKGNFDFNDKGVGYMGRAG